jgi:hypothetical protein
MPWLELPSLHDILYNVCEVYLIFRFHKVSAVLQMAQTLDYYVD